MEVLCSTGAVTPEEYNIIRPGLALPPTTTPIFITDADFTSMNSTQVDARSAFMPPSASSLAVSVLPSESTISLKDDHSHLRYAFLYFLQPQNISEVCVLVISPVSIFLTLSC